MKISATLTFALGNVTRTVAAEIEVPPAQSAEEEERGAWQNVLPELFQKLRDQEKRDQLESQ